MLDFKPILAIFTVILTFVGYVPYIRDILKGKTKPHVYSWFVWTLTSAITYGLQIEGGAGVGCLGYIGNCNWFIFYIFAEFAKRQKRYNTAGHDIFNPCICCYLLMAGSQAACLVNNSCYDN